MQPISDTKWTPGPWTCDLYTTGAFVSGSAVTVASVFGYTVPEGKANGSLIAAAPDLYEALLEISDALEGARAANPEASIEFFEELVEIEPGWRKRLKDALAKARGEA